MTDTQIIKELVGLEPDLNIFKIEQVKKKGRMVKIKKFKNRKTRNFKKQCSRGIKNVIKKILS